MLKFNRTASWLLLIGAMATCPPALVWGVPPVHPLRMVWVGDANGAGNGALDAWENWFGNSEVISAGPLVVNYYPPQAGDTLQMLNLNVWGDAHHSITGGSIVADVGLLIQLYSTFTGGTIDVAGIGIGGTPIVFNGTSLTASDGVFVGSTVTFNDATLTAPDVHFNGAINVNGGSVDADFYKMSNYVATFDGATLDALAAQIGTSDFPGSPTAELHLKGGSEFTVQYDLVVGYSGHGEIDMSEASQLSGDDMNALVGLDGVGFVHASGESTIDLHNLEVGVRAPGFVFLDTDAAMTTDDGKLGMVVGFDGTVNLENGGTWTTDDLTLGLSGNGWVYVRNDGTLTINGDAVLGKEPTGRGVLNLFGDESHVELGASGTLEIGHLGKGELNLYEGATFTSTGDVTLGKLADSTGIVRAEGDGSAWTVDGDLVLGEDGNGRLELKDGGAATIAGKLTIGLNEGSDGLLLLDGEDISITTTDDLILSGEGHGAIELRNGAELTLKEVLIGQTHSPGVHGELTVDGQGSQLTSTGEFVVGDASKGVLNITKAGTATTNGAATLSREDGSHSEVKISSDDGHAKWTVNGDLTAGAKGISHVLIENDGEVKINGKLALGVDEGSEGVFDLNGQQASLTTDGLHIGARGTGIFNIRHGAKVVAGRTVISSVHSETGVSPRGEMNIRDEGSEFRAQGELVVGAEQGRRGVLRVGPKGTAKADGAVIIARDAGSIGEVEINADPETAESRAKWTVGGNLTVGDGGEGNLFVVNGGRVTASSATSVDMAKKNGSQSVVQVDGEAGKPQTTFTHSGNFRVGVQGNTANLYIRTNALLQTAGDAMIAEMADSDGDVRIFGTDAEWKVAGKMMIGNGKSPSLTVLDHGKVTVAKEFELQENANLAEISISDGAQVKTGNVDVRAAAHIVLTGPETTWAAKSWSTTLNSHESTLDILDGAALVIYEADPGAFDIGDKATVRLAGSAQHRSLLTLDDAPVDVSGKLFVDDGSDVDSHSLFLVQGNGELHIKGPNTSFFANILRARGATLTVEDVQSFGAREKFAIAGGVATLKNVTESGVGINVNALESAGMLQIEGQTTTGETRIADVQGPATASVAAGSHWTVGNQGPGSGLFQLGGAGVGNLVLGAGSTVEVLGNFVVNKGSSWKGKGTIKAANFTNAGKGAPGASPGTLSINANFTQTADGVLELEVGGLTAGTQHDVLDITGTADVGGTVLMKFINGFAPEAGDQFTLIDASGLNLSSNVFFRNLKSDWQYSAALSNNQWIVTSLTDGVYVEPGDFNEDGAVNEADLPFWKAGFGIAAGARHIDGDADGDFDVDGADVAIWQQQLHHGSGAARASTGVPEAGALTLAGGATLAGLRFGRRPRRRRSV